MQVHCLWLGQPTINCLPMTLHNRYLGGQFYFFQSRYEVSQNWVIKDTLFQD